MSNLDNENAISTTFVSVDDDKTEAKSFAKDISTMEKYICVECNYRCHNSYDLELHLLRSHVDMEGYRCELCERIFMLETRWKKHMKMHESRGIKVCKYFKKKMHCPYEERGCKFRQQNQLTAMQIMEEVLSKSMKTRKQEDIENSWFIIQEGQFEWSLQCNRCKEN